MRKVKFGDLDSGSHFFWGGSQFVKTLQYKGGNSVELGTKSGVWGCFFDDVIVEIEVEEQANVPTNAERLAALAVDCEHVWGIDGQHSNEYCKKCFSPKNEVTHV